MCVKVWVISIVSLIRECSWRRLGYEFDSGLWQLLGGRGSAPSLIVAKVHGIYSYLVMGII